MQLPKYKKKKRIKLKICQEPGCAREFWGHPIAKYCELHRDIKQRAKLHVMQFLANLFRNHSTHAVATVARISGSTGGPKTDEWEVIRKLISNGLARAILPGFLADPKSKVPAQPPKPVPHEVGHAVGSVPPR